MKEGYKQTELGLIPEDWNIKKLGDLGIFFKGKGVPKSEITNEGYNCLTYGDLYTKYNIVIKNVKSFITQEVAEVSQEIVYGDICFAASGETLEDIGKSAVYLEPTPGYAGGDIIVFRGNQNALTLAYFLNSTGIKSQMYKFGQGHSVVHIYKSQIENLKIPLPPIEEQNAIANCLSTWDEAIEKQQKLIEAKEIRHKALMQKLLSGKKRLPGFTDEWKEVKLGEYINKIQNGYAFDAKSYLTNGIPIVTMGSINLSGEFTLNKSRCNYWAKDEKLERYILNDGDLIIAMTDVTPDKNLIGLTVIVQTDEVLYLNQRVGKLVLNSSYLDPKFIAYLSLNPIWRNQCKAFATLGVQANISTNDIYNIKISLPNLQEQQSIVEILNFTEKEIKKERLKIRLLKEQKKALMQKLLTGKVRLPLQN